MKEEKLVSIILPTRNRRNLLQKALESLKNQTYKNLEILVGDNCSTDDTEEYMLKQAEADIRIKYFRWEKNLGAYNNSARLLERVSGDYFVFFNDDDWLDLNYIEECIKFFDNNEGYAFVSPSIILYDDNYNVIKICYAPDLTSEDAEDRIKTFLAKNWVSDIVNGVFSKDILAIMMSEDGYYFKKRIIEDITFMVRTLAIGKGKVLTNVHYNKLNNGSTRVVENTPTDYYDVRGVNSKNFPVFCIKHISNIILSDKVFKSSIQNPKEYTKELKSYLENEWGLKKITKLRKIIKFLSLYKKGAFS